MNLREQPLAAWFVGIVLVVSVLGIIALSGGWGNGRPIPDVLQNIAVGSLTGLLGILVPSKNTKP